MLGISGDLSGRFMNENRWHVETISQCVGY